MPALMQLPKGKTGFAAGAVLQTDGELDDTLQFGHRHTSSDEPSAINVEATAEGADGFLGSLQQTVEFASESQELVVSQRAELFKDCPVAFDSLSDIGNVR